MGISTDGVEPLHDRPKALFAILVVAMVATPLLFHMIVTGFGVARSHPLALSGALLFQHGILFGLTLWRLRQIGSGWTALKPYVENVKQLAFGIGWGIGLLFINAFLAQLTVVFFQFVAGNEATLSLLTREQQSTQQLINTSSGPIYLGLMVFIAVGVAPVVEEVFFRGYVYPVLKQYVNRHALWVSALLFSAIHLYVINFLPIFVLGIVLARLYDRTGSLAVPIVAHATFNGIIAIIATLLPSVT